MSHIIGNALPIKQRGSRHFYKLATVEPQISQTILLELGDDLPKGVFYAQFIVTFTTLSNQTIVRVINFSLSSTLAPETFISQLNSDAIAVLIGKTAIEQAQRATTEKQINKIVYWMYVFCQKN